MLILARHTGGECVIRDRRTNEILCRVLVKQIRPHAVKLAFWGPKHVAVNRLEIDEAIQTSGIDEIAAKHAANIIIEQSPEVQS